MPRIKEIFHYHAANEDSYTGLTSKATVALLHGPLGNVDEFRGWFRFLVEDHFLFDTLLDEAALELPWDKYRAIILPDFQAVSDALAARLDDFVAGGRRGDRQSGRSGFRDEHFDPRDRPALQCLGIDRVLYERTDTASSYLQFDDKTGFPRFDVTDLLYVLGPYVYADYAADAQPAMRLIPPHSFGPPERCYYTQITDYPGYVTRSHGAGKAIYLPWLPGALFHRQGHTNTSDFAIDLLAHHAGIAPVEGTLPPMIEVTHFTNTAAGFDLVHLVNTSGNFGVTFYAPLPIIDQTITVDYPTSPRSVRSLVTGDAPDHSWSDGRLTVHLPRLDDFEALRIE